MKLNKLFALSLLAASSLAMAESAVAPLDVTATVQSSCELTTSPVAFGSFKPATSGNVDAAGAVRVTCTVTTPYTVDLGTGNKSSTFDTRWMGGSNVANADTLAYNLYLDSNRTQVWGDTTESTVHATGVGTGSQTVHSVYGRMAKSQFVTPDDYADVVTVTVSY